MSTTPDSRPSSFREVSSYNRNHIIIAETLESLSYELSESHRLYFHLYKLTNPFRAYSTAGPIYTISSDDSDS